MTRWNNPSPSGSAEEACFRLNLGEKDRSSVSSPGVYQRNASAEEIRRDKQRPNAGHFGYPELLIQRELGEIGLGITLCIQVSLSSD
jgi:hypothetical protein